MFGSYSMINIIVLLNMLIAMMSNSYQIIQVIEQLTRCAGSKRVKMINLKNSKSSCMTFDIFISTKLPFHWKRSNKIELV